MQINGTPIADTFAEAFRLRYVRLIVTALDDYWLDAALSEFCGYSSSIIGCDAEIGAELRLTTDQTPDGRVGAAVMVFGFSAEALAKALPIRAGQCLMTCPTTAVFDGLTNGEEQIPLGNHLRFFGDGFQKSKRIGHARFWRIPVMDGEFLIADKLHVEKGVGGGNFILQAADQATALAAVRRATAAISRLPGSITPFPAGCARSGSKIGSIYKALKASTADAYCPTLVGRVETTQIVPGANYVYEIVIDGAHEQAVADAMVAGIRAAAGDGILAITAGNYGGKLGKFHFHLRQLLAE